MYTFLKTGFWLIVAAQISLISLKAEAAKLVASRNSGTVLAFDEQTGDYLGVFIEQGSGGLEAPSSLAYGPNGNLYVSDYDNSSVLVYDGVTGDFIKTFIPSGSGGLISPETIAFGSDDELYIAGLDGNGVRRYDGETGKFMDVVVANDPATHRPLNTPNFVWAEDDELYISSVFPSGGILEYDEEKGRTKTFIHPEDAPTIPGGLAIGPEDGLLYVGDFSENASISRYNLKNGKFIDTFVEPGSGGLSKASRLLFRDGDLYVTSFGNNSVLLFDGETGNFLDDFIPSGSAGLDEPIGFVFSETPIALEESNHFLTSALSDAPITPEEPNQLITPVPEPTSILGLLGFGVYISTNLVQKIVLKKSSN